MSIEINGPANVCMLINHYYAQKIGKEIPNRKLLEDIYTQAMKTMSYMKHLENPKGIMWHNIEEPDAK